MTKNSKERFAQIRALQDDWNGYGAEPIKESVIKRAEQILEVLNAIPEPFIVPVATGNIQIEWESSEQGYVEITIAEDYCTVFGTTVE